MKLSIKDFFGKCDQIRRKLRIWSHLLKKCLMENFIFCAVTRENMSQRKPAFSHTLRSEYFVDLERYFIFFLTNKLALSENKPIGCFLKKKVFDETGENSTSVSVCSWFLKTDRIASFYCI